jgi:hypothetical protein
MDEAWRRRIAVIIDLPKRSTGTPVTCRSRGIEPATCAALPSRAHLRFGTNEVVVGRPSRFAA